MTNPPDLKRVSALVADLVSLAIGLDCESDNAYGVAHEGLDDELVRIINQLEEAWPGVTANALCTTPDKAPCPECDGRGKPPWPEQVCHPVCLECGGTGRKADWLRRQYEEAERNPPDGDEK